MACYVCPERHPISPKCGEVLVSIPAEAKWTRKTRQFVHEVKHPRPLFWIGFVGHSIDARIFRILLRKRSLTD